jgi:hypothetical protein
MAELKTYPQRVLANFAGVDASGNVGLGISAAATGTFGSSQANLNMQISINGLNFATEYSSQQGGNHQTEALSTGIVVPNTATTFQASAIGAYLVSNRIPTPPGGDVAGYFSARAGVSGANIFGINTVATDSGFANVSLNNEFDYNITNTGTFVVGMNVVLNATVPLTNVNGSNGYVVRSVNPAGKWSVGFYSATGAATTGLYLSPTGTAANSPSQNIELGGFDAGGLGRVSQIYSDPNGVLVLRSGQNGQPIALQDFNNGGGSNLLIVDTAGAASSVNISAPSMTTTPIAVSALPAVGPFVGTRTFVNNSTVVASGNFGAIVAGGGANTVPVYSDGTNWRIG